MNILIKLVMWINAARYGVIVLWQLLRETLKHGYREMFSLKPIPRPACLDDPALGTHGFLKLESKLRIHHVSSGPEDGPLMLFLHGFPTSWYSWKYQIKEFQRDYRCVAIEMRGYGQSDKPAGIDNYTVSVLTDDVRQVIQALGYKSCVLVTHDWGGLIGFAFGKFYPDFVDRLVVLALAPGPVFFKVLAKSKVQRQMSWYVIFFQLPYLPELWFGSKNLDMIDDAFGEKRETPGAFSGALMAPMTEEDITAHKYTISQPGALTPMINYYRALVQRPQVDYDIHYAMPVLVILGQCDPFVSEAIADQIQEENPQILVHRIPETSHYPMVEKPGLTNEIMREWLAKKSQ